ncbi:MAG: hypothetical protein IBX55_05335 [Methyloprofundus sp.]|nr:hypothetical protein [Methyloprofundus sp.]MBW6452708.1 hypothetical protein [Methyloprofundus sp.]
MDIYKFKSAPAPSNFQLPFELTGKAFDNWLLSLENSCASEKAHQVLLALQSINTTSQLASEKKALLLIDIYQAMPPFLEPLKNSVLNSSLPLTPEEQSHVDYIVWIYAELANSFARCINKKSNAANAQSFFYGLQSLIAAYLHISAVYDAPYANFWKQSYLLYGLASNLEIQDLTIDEYNGQSNTISKAFKQLIALYHCDLHQFRPRAIFSLATCIEKYTSLMLLEKKFTANNPMQYSGLDLNTDTPPSHLPRLKKTEKSALRFFSAFSAAIEINKNASNEAQGSGILKLINRELIQQACRSLSLQQKRQFTRIVEQKKQYGIMSLASIIQSLRNNSSLKIASDKKQIDQLDPRVAGGWAVPNLELVSEGYESLAAMKYMLDNATNFKNSNISQAKQLFGANRKKFTDATIWDNAEPTNASIQESLFHIPDSSIKGYKIIFNTDNNSSKVQVGDIIGIKHNDAIEVGIIRRITQLTGHEIELGIKLLALASELAYISLPDHDAIYTWALFLPGIKALTSNDSVVFNDHRFQAGEFITLHRADLKPQTCRLHNLLHLSSAAVHIEISNTPILD